MSDTLTVDSVLETAQDHIGAAAESAAGEGRWDTACAYLGLAGRLAQHREGLRVWPEERLSSLRVWRTADDLERLTDTAQREDRPELDPLTEAEAVLIDLAYRLETEEEGL